MAYVTVRPGEETTTEWEAAQILYEMTGDVRYLYDGYLPRDEWNRLTPEQKSNQVDAVKLIRRDIKNFRETLTDIETGAYKRRQEQAQNPYPDWYRKLMGPYKTNAKMKPAPPKKS